MKLIKQLPIRCSFVILSHNGKFAACIKASGVNIYDLNEDCLTDTINIKHCGKAVFSKDDKLLILKTTTSKLAVYDLVKREIVFNKKVGKNDGYDIIFVNDNQILTGDWNNNHILLNLETLELQKFAINGVGMSRFLTKSGDRYIICHCPIAEDAQEIAFVGYSFKPAFKEKTEILFLNEAFQTVGKVIDIEDSLALNFAFADGKIFAACANL